MSALRQLAGERVTTLEAQLRRECGGSVAAGGMSYAEVCSRGAHRFDMLLCAEGSLSFAVGGSEPAEAAEAAAVEAAVEVAV